MRIEMFTLKQIEKLTAPLSRMNVKERQQSGRSFSYIEGWYAISEANRIFGFDNWSRETFECKLVNENTCKIGKDKRDGWNVTYIARVRIRIGDIIRDGTGAGHGSDANLGLAHESAIKEAETDAMKRALMTFGNPFGLALYDKEQKDVVDEPEMTVSDVINYQLETIKTFKTEAALKKWWVETNSIRSSYGIVKGTDEYEIISSAAVNQADLIKGDTNG
jgi:DNA recombination protein Rad52